jgi:hypothetical protein
MSKRIVLGGLAAIAACLLAVPANADNATKTYAGAADAGAQIALDVSLKNGKAKTISGLRAVSLLLHCDTSGDVPTGHVNLPVSIKVNKHGKFHYSFTDPTYNQTSTIAGKFKGKNVSGTFVDAAHFPAEDQYPEENCHTDQLNFTAKSGAPDQTGDA